MSDVEVPTAPSSIACRTSAFISSSCPGVGCTSSSPRTTRRTCVSPTSWTTLIGIPMRSTCAKYSAYVRQRSSSPFTTSPQGCVASLWGAADPPSPER